MEYEKALEVLKTLLEKQTLTPEEKEAVQTALGLLSLTVISKSRLKNRLQKERTQQDKKNLKW
jgi:hypothetical protein